MRIGWRPPSPNFHAPASLRYFDHDFHALVAARAVQLVGVHDLGEREAVGDELAAGQNYLLTRLCLPGQHARHRPPRSPIAGGRL